MNREIEEMAKDICEYNRRGICALDKKQCDLGCTKGELFEQVYNAGYSKQRVGRWIGKTDYAGYGYYCSNCNAVFKGENAEWIAKEHNFCPKCGAKMKGESDA